MLTLNVLKSIVIGTALTVSPAALADCWNAETVADDAHELDRAAEHFHELIHDLEGYSHLAHDAHYLARVAAHFHESVEAGADCYHIRDDFADVRFEYNHLYRALLLAHEVHHDPHVMDDWAEVSAAYEQAQRDVAQSH